MTTSSIPMVGSAWAAWAPAKASPAAAAAVRNDRREDGVDARGDMPQRTLLKADDVREVACRNTGERKGMKAIASDAGEGSAYGCLPGVLLHLEVATTVAEGALVATTDRLSFARFDLDLHRRTYSVFNN